VTEFGEPGWNAGSIPLEPVQGLEKIPSLIQGHKSVAALLLLPLAPARAARFSRGWLLVSNK
jgi:hypothetical protein